mgnify:CR=1 FL=1
MVVVLRVFGLSGSHWKLGLTVLLVVEYFKLLGCLLIVVGFRVISRLIYRWLDFEVRGMYNMLTLLSKILTKMDFKDKNQFKWGRVVTSSFEKVSYFGNYGQ